MVLHLVSEKFYNYQYFSFSVDRESVAEKCGLRVGDQIIEANGRSFEAILHKDAVEFFKTYENVVLTVKVIFIDYGQTFIYDTML